MMQTTDLRLPLVLALAVALCASPALAVAKQSGKGPEEKRERPELIRRGLGQSEKAAKARREEAEKEQKARARELRQERESRDDRREEVSWGDGDRGANDARRDGWRAHG